MAMNQQELTQWAQGFLQYLGSPASGPNDPRVAFLVAQGLHEGTPALNNPLAITNSEGQPGSALAGNTAGVRQFKTAQEGYAALRDYFIRQNITGLFGALHNPNTTVTQLTNELTQAHWEGSANAEALANSTNYATAIGTAASRLLGEPVPNGAQPLPNTGVNATPGGTNPIVPPKIPIQGMSSTYTGPGAYKGFNLQYIPGTLRRQTAIAINAYNTDPAMQQKMDADIIQQFGQYAWAAQIPAMKTVLLSAVYNHWTPNQFAGVIDQTHWYQALSDNQRLWTETVASNPGQAYTVLQQMESTVMSQANALGRQLTQAQVQQIATAAVSQTDTKTGTYSNNAETVAQITQMINTAAAAGSGYNLPGWHNIPLPTQARQSQWGIPQQLAASGTGGTSSLSAGVAGNPQEPGAVTGQGGGDASTLFNQFSTLNREYMLGLTPEQLSQYVNQFMSGDTGQGNFMSGAVAGFTNIAQNKAKQMYPALGSAIGTTDSSGNAQTPWSATDWVRNTIAQFTGQGTGNNIDLTSPQWSWILSGSAPPSNRAAGLLNPSQTGTGNGLSDKTPSGNLPSLDQLQSYLMGTPQFQTTHLAKSMAWNVGDQILKSFGFSG